MEYKKAQVIMLPSTTLAKVGEYIIAKHEHDDSLHCGIKRQNPFNMLSEEQHLYITTDDEIKEGDWFVAIDSSIQQAKSNYEKLPSDRKIIATTDPELTVLKDVGDEFEVRWEEVRIAQPSKDFIEKYCKVGGIDEVDVEYNPHGNAKFERSSGFDGYRCQMCNDWFYSNKPKCSCSEKIKVDSHNTITIHPIKDSYSHVRELDQRKSIKK